MSKIFWEVKTLMCDICKERPLIKTIELSKGNWVGVCSECEPKKDEPKLDK